MKQTIIWWVAHLAQWAVLYGAFILNLDGAMSVLKFFVWFCAAASFGMLSDSCKRPPSPRYASKTLSWVLGWVTLLALVWYGHIFSALAYGWFMAICASWGRPAP